MENTNMTYKPGQSGNLNGRPAGIKNKRTQLATLLEQHAEALINKTVELALNGDSNALRLCIERLIPKAKDGTANIVLPIVDATRINTPLEMGRAILNALSGQEINLDQAKSLLNVLKYCDNSPSVFEANGIGQDAQKLNELLEKYNRDY